jgi:division/cell wall cluster transcriptional repressor MraZ
MVIDTIINKSGRMFVPSTLREVLGDSFVIAKCISKRSDKAYLKPCLRIYSTEQWQEFCDNVERKNPTKTIDKLLQFLAFRLTQLDKLGRIYISSELCRYAKLRNDLTVVECEGFFEIWSEQQLYEWEMQQPLTYILQTS